MYFVVSFSKMPHIIVARNDIESWQSLTDSTLCICRNFFPCRSDLYSYGSNTSFKSCKIQRFCATLYLFIVKALIFHWHNAGMLSLLSNSRNDYDLWSQVIIKVASWDRTILLFIPVWHSCLKTIPISWINKSFHSLFVNIN